MVLPDCSAGFARLFARNLLLVLLLGCQAGSSVSADTADKDVSIMSQFKGEAITLTVSPEHYAGAVRSLRYRGVEYIEVSDHGRQMQSALQLDGLGECFNPTEAGSKADARKSTTSSKITGLVAGAGEMVTRTKAAFWLAPGEHYLPPSSDYEGYCSGPAEGRKNGARQARNKTILSDFVVEKKLRFDTEIPNLLTVDTTWTMPSAHASANIEALTAYLPRSFGIFLVYDPQTKNLTGVSASDIDSDRQHTTKAVIISRLGGREAMGAFAPAIMENPALGYMSFFDFPNADAPTTKWACLFYREKIKAGIPYTEKCNVAIGTVGDVIKAIDLYQEKNKKADLTSPVYRFYKAPIHRMALSYDDGSSDGFNFEKTAFHVFINDGPGLKRIDLCSEASGRSVFIEKTDQCRAGHRRLAGYVGIHADAGLVPLFSFRQGNDVLVTTDRQEGVQNGYELLSVIGYVPRDVPL